MVECDGTIEFNVTDLFRREPVTISANRVETIQRLGIEPSTNLALPRQQPGAAFESGDPCELAFGLPASPLLDILSRRAERVFERARERGSRKGAHERGRADRQPQPCHAAL